MGKCGDEDNREKANARRRLYRAANRESDLAYKRRYRQEHREQCNASKRRYHKKYRDKEQAYQRRWRRNNPDKRRIYALRRQANKRNLPNTLTNEEARHLLAIGHTMYPGEELHLDHIVPLSRGGGTTYANTHAIPARINCSKQDALPEEAYQQLVLSAD